MIQLYTGDGKGKTTAAVGQAMRAAGNGWKVCFAQFMKGNETGELHSMERLENVFICRSPKNFGFYHTLSENEKQELAQIHNDILNNILEEVKSGTCEMVILDEVTYPVNWGLIDLSKLKSLLSYGDKIEIIMTGRTPAVFLTECADYITEMKCIRHPYQKGIGARCGIEF